MAKRISLLSDIEWAQIEPILPKDKRGTHRVDDHTFISGIVSMLKCGAR